VPCTGGITVSAPATGLITPLSQHITHAILMQVSITTNLIQAHEACSRCGFQAVEHITVDIQHGTEPAYLADSLRLTSEDAARRHLHSVNSPTMLVPSTRRSTQGDRTFPVAAARAWNSLPPQTTAASSLLTFRWETKSHLFRQSFG